MAPADVMEHIHIGAGIIFNCLLLYAIRRFTRPSLGSYKHLLTIFAIFDIFLTSLHATVQPRVVIVGTTFGVWSVFEKRIVCVFYTACFTVPFALMIVHFVYRFWAIRHPHLTSLFSNKMFIAGVACYPVAAFATWFLMAMFLTTENGPGKDLLRAETLRRFGRELRNGWLIANHWENEKFNTQAFVCLVFVDAVMITSFLITTILASLTFYHIKKTEAISLQARKLQRKLFVAVCAQTAVPSVFVYIPYFCVINFPFFYLPVYFWDDACMLLTSCFPAWDAVIIIVLMKDYRMGLLGLIRKKRAPQAETLWMTKTTIVPVNASALH